MHYSIKFNRQFEEIINSSTHGLGIIGAITCTVILLNKAFIYGSYWHIATFSIFGGGLILLYIASTLFHAAKNLRSKSRLNKFDQSSIFVLIAATYTPIAILGVRGTFGWIIFVFEWVIALAGIAYKIWFYASHMRTMSTIIYIAMGLVFLVAIVPIIKNTSTLSLFFLVFGCSSYIIGAVFYLLKKIPLNHAIFHFFVLGGSLCHFLAIYYLL